MLVKGAPGSIVVSCKCAGNRSIWKIPLMLKYPWIYCGNWTELSISILSPILIVVLKYGFWDGFWVNPFRIGSLSLKMTLIAKNMQINRNCIRDVGIEQYVSCQHRGCWWLSWWLHCYTLRSTKLKGVYWFHLVLLSVCLSVDRIVSTLYLLQYSLDPFHIYTSYRANAECVMHVNCFQNWKIINFGKFFKFVIWTSSCFDLGSNMNCSRLWAWDPIWTAQ